MKESVTYSMFSIIWFESIFPVAIVKVGCTYVKVASEIQDFVAKSRKENMLYHLKVKQFITVELDIYLKYPSYIELYNIQYFVKIFQNINTQVFASNSWYLLQ